MAMTMVLPEPVAILEHSRLNSPPSLGMSTPTFSESGASISQISVSYEPEPVNIILVFFFFCSSLTFLAAARTVSPSPGLTESRQAEAHTPIRARHADGYMRLLAVGWSYSL